MTLIRNGPNKPHFIKPAILCIGQVDQECGLMITTLNIDIARSRGEAIHLHRRDNQNSQEPSRWPAKILLDSLRDSDLMKILKALFKK